MTLGLAAALEELGNESLPEADALYRSLSRKLGNDPISKEAQASRSRVAYHAVRLALPSGLRKEPDHEKSTFCGRKACFSVSSLFKLGLDFRSTIDHNSD